MRKPCVGLLGTAILAFAPVLVAENVPGRYIVELQTEPVADHVARLQIRGRMQSAAAVSHRGRVRSEQQQLRRELERRNAQVLEGVDTVANALFVQVSDEEAARLAALPGVKRVIPVRKLRMLMDRAVLLHKVADAWQQAGEDRAGQGVKIAILDSGIDAAHPGFQDTALAAPETFPRASQTTDLAYTNGKVIVARSYVNLLPYLDPDSSARDRVGHGTALAMIAAGVRNAGPLATIQGVAPKAFLGNYKVFGTPGFNDSTTDDVVLKALDDAVADGMDIINLSLGDDLAPRLEDDPEVQAVERATKAGVIVVAAAGNNGPDLNTMSSPATAPSAIAVGATTNDRMFAASVELAGGKVFAAVPGAGLGAYAPITGLVSDVAAIDGDGLACSPLPAGSLANHVALIQRGSCTFETKLNNAQRAGAVAALIYAAADAPNAFVMAIGAASLPAEMVSHEAGLAIKEAIAAQSAVASTLRFSPGTVPVAANRLTDFTAAGPSVDVSIKPDLVAVGGDVYTATQTLDPRGEMYDSSGFVQVDGTSFSTPLVAGAAALLKAARPGLSVDQYRSLLINTAAPVEARSGQVLRVQQTGAGILDASAALRSAVAAYPTSLSFGAGGGDVAFQRTVRITNVGLEQETYTVGVIAQGSTVGPAAGADSIRLDPGASADVPIVWEAGGLSGGTYEGFINVTAGATGITSRIPYWYAVTTGTPATVTILDAVAQGRRGSSQRDAVLFRITDASGVNVAAVEPQVTVISGGGIVQAVHSYDREVPGLFGLDVALGAAAGANKFRIQAGEAAVEVSIAGQ